MYHQKNIIFLENKLAKRKVAKSFLNKESLLALYYFYIGSNLNYANLAWGITFPMNVKQLCSQLKHAI